MKGSGPMNDINGFEMILLLSFTAILWWRAFGRAE